MLFYSTNYEWLFVYKRFFIMDRFKAQGIYSGGKGTGEEVILIIHYIYASDISYGERHIFECKHIIYL